MIVRTFIKKLSIVFIVTISFFTIFEIVCEFFGPIPSAPPPIAFWGPEADRVNLNGLADSFRPNHQWLWEPNPGAVFCGEKMNEDGYRGRIFTKQKTAATRIITFGDSSTMGFGVSEAESWPRVLETILRDTVLPPRGFATGGHDVEVINFGCVGHSAYQGEQLYLGRARDYKPDIVILAFGAINESFETQDGAGQIERVRILSSFPVRLRAFLQRFTFMRYLFLQFQPDRAAAGTLAPRRGVRNLSPEDFQQSYCNVIKQQKREGRSAVFVTAPRRRSVELEFPHVMEYTNATRAAAASESAPLADVYSFFRTREPAQENLTIQIGRAHV